MSEHLILISPPKLSPPYCIQRFQWLCHFLKQLWYSSSAVVLCSHAMLCRMFGICRNTFPFKMLFSLGKRERSLGIKYDKYCEWNQWNDVLPTSFLLQDATWPFGQISLRLLIATPWVTLTCHVLLEKDLHELSFLCNHESYHKQESLTDSLVWEADEQLEHAQSSTESQPSSEKTTQMFLKRREFHTQI